MIDCMFRALGRAVAAGVLSAASVAAAAFPTRQITIVVPFGPGSSTDVMAREIGKAWSEQLGHTVVVDNKPGAEGLIGAQAVLTAAPDGHTLMFTSSSLTVLDVLMKKQLPYDPKKDFAPICGVGANDSMLNVGGASPYNKLADFVAAAKANPGKLTFGYASATTRLAGEIFAEATGVKLTAVPYKTTVAGLTDVAGGQIDAFFVDHVSTAPFRQSGKMRALVVSGKQRVKNVPDVPAGSEVGLHDTDPRSFFAYYVSSKTPPELVGQLRQIVDKVMKSAPMQEMIDRRALIPVSACGDELSSFIEREKERLRKPIERAGLDKP
jgi:tripartite-type tricarboxylate transporter receptor subunit TctC